MRGRAVVCERLEMFPVECVARGYLTGSGLREYAATGEVCGIALPPGLEDGSRLAEPIFTPATKAALGDHDENVSFDAVVTEVGAEAAARLRDLTLAVYGRAEGIARERGIILADTKLEFGSRPDGTTVLGDEVLTPDSSRFWPADQWQPGRAQPSFDKDIVRGWLTSAAVRLGPRRRRPAARAARRDRRAHPRAVRRRPTSCSRGSPGDRLRRSALPGAAGGGLRLPRGPAEPAGLAVQPLPRRGGRPGSRASGSAGST